jgi:hypothetical protein
MGKVARSLPVVKEKVARSLPVMKESATRQAAAAAPPLLSCPSRRRSVSRRAPCRP